MEKTIYIYMDDSGKMVKQENCFSFGGIFFVDRDKRDDFKRLYSSFIKENKCKFCSKTCDNECPEIKSNNTNNKFRRRIVNMIKNKEGVYAHSITIYNKNINDEIFKEKKSKGRRIDYYQKILIKEIVKKLLKNKNIDKNDDLKIIINIDEAKTATNGIYNLKESIIEELRYGIINFNYGYNFPPILKGNLKVEVNYVDSSKNFLVQASDFLVGYVNNSLSWNKNNINFINVQLVLD